MLVSAMSRHVLLDLNAHDSLLAIGKVPVANGEALEQRIVDGRHLSWIDRYELVLFVKVPNVFDLPFV
jgi:hypothetical protein